jgi:Beta-glucosidase/6-phospho-beta-glucosidase/beta-galactosidase
VKLWITINEPFRVIKGYSDRKGTAPSLGQPGIADYLAARTILLAHARAYHVYQDEFRSTQKGSAVYLLESGFRIMP